MKKQLHKHPKLGLSLLGGAGLVVLAALLWWLWLSHPNKAQDQATAEDLFTLQTAIDNKPDLQSLQNLAVSLRRPLSTYTYTNTTQRGGPSSTYTLCGVFTGRSGLESLPANERTPRLGNGTTNVYAIHGQGTQCYLIASTPKGKWVDIQLHNEDIRPLATVKTDFAQFTANTLSTYQSHMQTFGALGSGTDIKKACHDAGITRHAYRCSVAISNKLLGADIEQTKANLDALAAKLKAQGFTVDKRDGTKMQRNDGTIELLDNMISVTGTTADCTVVVVFNPDNATAGASYDYTCLAPYSATAPKGFN